MRLKLSLPLLCRLLHHECKYSGKDGTEKITTRCVQDTRPWDCCRKRGAVLKEWEQKKVGKKIRWRKKKRTKTTEKLTISSLQQDKSPTWVCLHKNWWRVGWTRDWKKMLTPGQSGAMKSGWEYNVSAANVRQRNIGWGHECQCAWKHQTHHGMNKTLSPASERHLHALPASFLSRVIRHKLTTEYEWEKEMHVITAGLRLGPERKLLCLNASLRMPDMQRRVWNFYGLKSLIFLHNDKKRTIIFVLSFHTLTAD